jgi:hypothetical protein
MPLVGRDFDGRSPAPPGRCETPAYLLALKPVRTGNVEPLDKGRPAPVCGDADARVPNGRSTLNLHVVAFVRYNRVVVVVTIGVKVQTMRNQIERNR